jgi:hypothetical protein
MAAMLSLLPSAAFALSEAAAEAETVSVSPYLAGGLALTLLFLLMLGLLAFAGGRDHS